MYSLSVDQNIIDTYSVKYEHNKEAIDNTNWNDWRMKNIAFNTHNDEPTEITIPKLIHNPKTPLTDILDIHYFPGRGCVVSKKFVELINQFNLPRIKSFPVPIEYQSEIHDYEYLFFIDDYTDKIDYTKTLFDIRINRVWQKNVLFSYSKWVEEIKNQSSLSVKDKDHSSNIIFQPFQTDIFSLQRIYFNSIIVSEALKNKMENELFGLRFRKCENYKFS